MAEENDKSAEVLQRAIEIFSARGYRATSMNVLARQVDLSKSTLYHYFRSKEDLLLAIYRTVIADNIAAAKSISVGGAPAESLRQILVDRVVYTCNNNRILRVVYEEEAELPKRLSNEVVRSRRAYQEILVEVLERGLKDGSFQFDTTPNILANTLLGACIWSYKWYRPDGRMTPEQLADDVAGVLLNGVLARPRR